MVFFIGSEVMLFGSFFTAYFFVRYNVADTWPPLNQDGEPFELPKVITAVNTAILVASSFTLHWAEHRLKHYNDRKGLQRGLIVTILLGATFLIIQINEYIHLGFTPQDTAFGSTLLHAHRRTRAARLRGPHDPHPVPRPGDAGPGLLPERRPRRSAPASLYWHFVDVVWVLLFFLVYLL